MSDDIEGAGIESTGVGPELVKREFMGITPRGIPEKPIVETIAVLAALYFTAYLPSDSSAIGRLVASPVFYIYSIASALPAILLVLYTMATTEGLPSFRVGPLRARSIARAALLALTALIFMLGLGALLGALGAANPIWGEGKRASAALIPLVLACSAAVGYAEELSFRAYLLRRLGQSGLARPWAIAVSTLLFALAHGAQGLAGILVAGALGLIFALRFAKAGDLHEIALAHGAYNAVIFLVQLYALPG